MFAPPSTVQVTRSGKTFSDWRYSRTLPAVVPSCVASSSRSRPIASIISAIPSNWSVTTPRTCDTLRRMLSRAVYSWKSRFIWVESSGRRRQLLEK